MTDKVLLIGNGVNNVKQDYKWSDLIDNLVEHIGATGQIENNNKPFPLLYEEIFIEAVKNRSFKEIEIKEFITREVLEFKANKIHQEIINLGCSNILTTNYDFTFESLFSDKTQLLKNKGIVKETRYSVFRHHNIEGINFWHIHGDSNTPSSITLGYEHYSGYLQQMRNYVATGTGTSYKTKFEPLTKRLKSGINENYSWLDFFFTKDIYIIGLTLDFIEIHLWWLLTFRQRAKLVKKLHINNKITYFYPSSYAGKIKNKLDLLKSVGVLPYSVKYDESNKQKYYRDVINKIKSSI